MFQNGKKDKTPSELELTDVTANKGGLLSELKALLADVNALSCKYDALIHATKNLSNKISDFENREAAESRVIPTRG